MIYRISGGRLANFKYFFCQSNDKQPMNRQKIQTMPQNKKKSYWLPQEESYSDEFDYFNKKRPLKVNKQIHFKNCRHLIYLNKQHLFTPYVYSSYLSIPFFYISYLIYTNPFYLTFPAALPLMFTIDVILFLRWGMHRRHHKNQIERVYLMSDGSSMEFIYSNKIRRYIKNNQMNKPFFIQIFDEKYDPVDDQRYQMIRGTRFPLTHQDIKKKPTFWQYGWTKRDKYFNNYIIPSNNYEYCDWDMMIACMNGQIVDVEGSTNEGEYEIDNYPPIEEELENIKKLQAEKALQNQQSKGHKQI